MKKLRLTPQVLLALLIIVSFSKVYSQTQIFSKEVYENDRGEKLLYRQMQSDYTPEAKYPLVIFLHGSGERGDDNEAQLKWGVLNFATSDVMKNYPAVVIAPQCPRESSWGNYDYEKMTLKKSPTKTMALLIELIEEKIATMPIDTNRIYITGLSMGGFGTFDLLSRRPELFAAAVPVCGGGDVSKAKDIAHIPMWIFHGANDGAVETDLSQEMVIALQEAGAKPGYTQYPEVGHFSWIAAYSDAMMMTWLFRQHK